MIVPDDESTHPLDLSAINFKAFSEYLKTFKKSVKRTRPQDDENLVISETVTVRLSAGAYDNACSALAFLFVECDIDKNATNSTKDLWRKIGLYKKGCRRRTAQERQSLGLRTQEGKERRKM
jgi:hypothetical protein